MREQPTGEGKEVGSKPDGDADEENCREDPGKRGGHTATAAHPCTLNTLKLTLRWDVFGARDKGTS